MSEKNEQRVRLIVGLGNPGTQYTETRHNIGFKAIDALADEYGATGFMSKFKGECAAIQIDGQKILLLKPQTFMNLSGQSVLAALSFLKLKPEEVLVIHDDIDLKVGEIKTKKGGGHGGHNGLRDIDAKIGKEYHRLRIGVGHPRNIPDCPVKDPADYVLGRFSSEEQAMFKNKINQIVKDIKSFISID